MGVKVKLDLASKDYIYTLALPRWKKREIAVPDLSFSIKFQPDEVGTYKLLGDQMYGYTHPNLLGTLTVLSRSDFEDWLRERSPKPK